ncbi:threonine ammonia-lyase [Paenibacillus koleovorans]|uniref:threonine ammonia-lyase n=1 Tax=Paenibacillus koleovorans TaxID=121608 RepID=UPI000FDBE99D|nr:threonine ammonia-lyase [Paenibacillus koleovorans]
MQYQDIMRAKYKLEGHIHRTPLAHSKTLSEKSGSDVYLKLENLQKTGAFKVRGAWNRIAHLSPEERQRGVITASAGNHAQGVALSAAQAGIRSTIVMPIGATAAKIAATRSYGSEVVLHGANYDEAFTYANEVAERTGAIFVHAFNDSYVIAGQGTIGSEILDELPHLDAIVVPVGGGGLISGIGLAVKSIRPETMIIGVQPEQAASGYRSWKTGQLQRVEKPLSIADGLAVKQPGALPLAWMRRVVDEFVTVSEKQIAEAMFLLLERNKLLVEGAGAASVAALLSGVLPLAGKRVALVVSGGNVDLSKLAELYTSQPVIEAPIPMVQSLG